MSNSKMKGLLKGLRYISQIFENEKEPDIQIGFPTDVKHVSHIGWDGGSVNTPSWMNEFKSSAGLPSATIADVPDGEVKEDTPVKWVSQDSARKPQGTDDGTIRDYPGLPKTSRHRLPPSPNDSPPKVKPRRRSDGSDKSRRSKEASSQGGDSLKVPKKNRRKASKDFIKDGSSRSSRTRGSEGGSSDCGSISSVSNVGG